MAALCDIEIGNLKTNEKMKSFKIRTEHKHGQYQRQIGFAVKRQNMATENMR